MNVQDRSAAQKFYDRISAAYDLIADSGERAARERGLERLDAQPGERLLEIGHGTGHSLVQLAKAVGPSGRVFGVDISQGMHDLAARHVADAGLADNVELAVAAVPPLPYSDASMDGVTMSFTLELFPLDQIPVVLTEIHRVLRPGGRLSVVSMATVKDGQHESLLEQAYKWLHLHFPHFVDCQPIDVFQFVSNAGFVNVDEKRIEIWTLPVALITARKSH
ncbi:methyltransferase domain-containing protein [bacterium]|nr:methyltransferase domain-containing protein [bacterium]